MGYDASEKAQFDRGNLIFQYTRKQAIADGVLIDLSSSFPSDSRLFTRSLCCTHSVWLLIETAAECDQVEVGMYVWDLCWMCFMAVNAVKESHCSEVDFNVCLPIGTPEKQLKLVCSPGDEGEPVLTIMLPGED